MFKVCFLLLSMQIANAYMFSTANHTDNVKWKNRSSEIKLNVDSNSNIFAPGDIQSILQGSISSWSSSSPYSINANYNNNSDNAQASFEFSSDPRLFGSGVIAVTILSYNESSGIIYNGAIKVNESVSQQTILTMDKTQSSGGLAYLGDVVTHEIGHLLGLSHSEVYDSSMIFSVFKGQHNIKSDDVYGLKNLYGTSNGKKIYGKVVGGNHSPVLGAHVQLISLRNNNIVAGVFTNEEGAFEFENLSSSDEYILYMDKIKSLDNLDGSLSNVTSRYCSLKSYRPSFFSSCDSSKKGEAKILTLKSRSSIDVGEFTVRCSLQVKADYLISKAKQNSYLVRMSESQNSFSHTGYFTDDQINGVDNKIDTYEVDLRNYEVSGASSSSLRMNLMINKLGSQYFLDLNIKNLITDTLLTKTYSIDPETSKPLSEISYNLPLSSNESENHFEVTIVPRFMSSGQKQSVFASPSQLGSNQNIYQLSLQILEYDSSIANDMNIRDNSSCNEGEVAYKASRNITSSSDVNGSASGVTSCATITSDKSTTTNFFSLILGFIMILSIRLISIEGYKSLSK